MNNCIFEKFKLTVFSLLFLLAGISGVSAATFTGTLSTADPTYNRPVSCVALSGVGTAVRYRVFNFTLSSSQIVTISLSTFDGAVFTAPSNSNSIDTFLTLYGTGGFSPASPLTNCLAVNDDRDGASDRRSRIVSGVLAPGTYTYVVAAFDNTPTGPSILPWAYTGFISNPVVTAAGVRVTGRVLAPNGNGIYKARVAMTDAEGNTRTALTNNFGYYDFEDVPAGATYIFDIAAKQYQFASQVVNVSDNIAELNFTALE